jgi:predicted RNA-binding protein Jag
MKSIIEEASSVVKAIEKGWIQAGKPQEFSIKVFQEAEKNFLGMTTKSAKIAVLYEESSLKVGQTPERKTHKPAAPTKQKATIPAAQPAPQRPLKKQPEEKPAPRDQKQTPKQPVAQKTADEDQKTSKKTEPFWSEQMITEITDWLKTALSLVTPHVPAFTLDPKRYYLKISFSKPLFEDAEKEKVVFRSFAYILMQVLRNKFKRNFRGFKIILTTEA